MTRTRFGAVLAIATGLTATACGPGTEPQPAPDMPPQAELSQIASLAASCSGCHASGDAIVSLDGMSAEMISASLMSYKTDDGTTVMHRMARGFTDEQVVAIADYLAEQAAEPAP